MSAAEHSSPQLHLLPEDEQFQARSTTSISLPLARASREDETNKCFIIMGTKLQSQDSSRNADFQLPGPPVQPPVPPCPQTLSHSHETLSKTGSRAAPKEQFVPCLSSQLTGLSTAPSIQDGGGIVRCGTSINISERNR